MSLTSMLPVKLLLAEDDEDDRYLFYTFLNDREDIIILPVMENGVELMSFLDASADSNLPQLIILDQNMPKMKGKETLERLKSDDDYHQIPVVIYSTYIDKELIRECTEAGACLVLTKPVHAQGYQRMMDEILRKIAK